MAQGTNKPVYLIFKGDELFTNTADTAATADGTEEQAVERAKQLAKDQNIHVADLKVKEFKHTGRIIDVHN